MGTFCKRNDLAGTIVGRLTVIEFVGSQKGHAMWRCKCSCGTEKICAASNLVRKHTLSCGCHKRDALTKHGECKVSGKSPTYRSWASMVSRCTDPNVKEYKNYGGRGIRVCERWQDFRNFKADMGARPPKTTLERKDTNGNYTPDNCCWADWHTQGNNRRNNHFVTVCGEPMTMMQASRKLGIHYGRIRYAVKKNWPLEALARTS